MVEDRHSPGAPLLQVGLQHSPDSLEQGSRDVGHGVYLPSIQVETLVRKAILSQAVHINLIDIILLTSYPKIFEENLLITKPQHIRSL